MERRDSTLDNYLVAIDDEPELLAIIARVAGELGFRVETTTSPTAFKRLIQAGMPAVILLDLQIPDCDGVELLRFLAERQSRAAIVLVSGVDERLLAITKSLGEALELDMAPPLRKPIRVAALRAALRAFLTPEAMIDAAALRAALEGEQVVLFYQPLIDLRTARLIGWEALARWRHPDFGLIAPDRFIGLAEREGLIDLLTARVLDLAVRQLADWRRLGLDEAFVSVNLSPLNLHDAELPDRLERLCARHNVPPRLLRLELTESAATGEAARSVEVLTRLRVKNFALAIDDFGTGYSSLLQLHRLPFSDLKIDQSFVRTMETSEEAGIIVRAIIGLADALRLEPAAEGIETAEQAARLTAAGCAIGQGFHFGKPMPPEDVPAWRDANRHFLPC